ncbi:hypothetical protein [Nocardia altamirensis]|nr:hypothetical protein [Nocardia altamirensis]
MADLTALALRISAEVRRLRVVRARPAVSDGCRAARVPSGGANQ